MFKRMGFLFNLNICVGCRACEMACRNENHTPAEIHWRNVRSLGNGTYLSMSCNHCDSPECFRVCPEKAFTKRPDGIVEIDVDHCNGCHGKHLCYNACPYNVPQYNPATDKVSRCQMCYSRQDHGLPPACVEACTTGALKVVDFNSFLGTDAIAEIPGFSHSKLTEPSILFYPTTDGKRHFIKKQP